MMGDTKWYLQCNVGTLGMEVAQSATETRCYKNKKASHRLGENTGQTYPTKDLDLEYIRKSLQLKRQILRLKKWAKDLSRHFSKEKYTDGH